MPSIICFLLIAEEFKHAKFLNVFKNSYDSEDLHLGLLTDIVCPFRF